MPIYDRDRVQKTGGHLNYFKYGELELMLEYAKRCGGPVLDLACCAGRLTMHLAKNGITAIGLDASRAALELALKEKKKLEPETQHRLHFVQGDMFRFHFNTPFPLITIAFHSFWFNIDPRRKDSEGDRCLECIMENLVPGGTFLIDSPYAWIANNETEWWLKAGEKFGFALSIRGYTEPSTSHFASKVLVGTKKY